MIMIEARGLTKKYGKRTTVKGIDLTVHSGEVVALIGPNGAGKSTTLEMILGLRKPDSGNIAYWTSEPKRHIGVQLQNTPFFPGLTASENLNVMAAFYGLRITKRKVSEILSRCNLQHVARTEASRLSGGEQKRLAIAISLVHDPAVLFLDEPTAALDPRARHEIRELIRSIARSGTSVVFTSHDMEEVEKLADRLILVCDGEVRAQGTPQDLLASYGVSSLDALYLALTVKEAI